LIKYQQMSTKSCEKVAPVFYCVICDYTTSRKSSYDKHVLTDKHKINILSTKSFKKLQNIGMFTCKICSKAYKERSGLWRHNKKCTNTQVNSSDTDNIDSLSDKELITMLVKQNEKLMNIVENGTHNTNNTNNTNTNCNNTTNNTAFNLNFFLNETCKDALNITDFVSSIKLSLEDLEYTGRRGYIEGMTNIILKNLKGLEQHQRPIHCSDIKREVLYIKEKNKWEKENDEKHILTNAIKVIANENIKQIQGWKEQNPDCTDSDSKKNNLYLKIVSNSMSGLDKDETNKNINKIISNVAKETMIQKDRE